jgi:hypothetical protein
MTQITRWKISSLRLGQKYVRNTENTMSNKERFLLLPFRTKLRITKKIMSGEDKGRRERNLI